MDIENPKKTKEGKPKRRQKQKPKKKEKEEEEESLFGIERFSIYRQKRNLRREENNLFRRLLSISSDYHSVVKKVFFF